MLDAVMRYLPSPYDVGAVIGTDPDDESNKSSVSLIHLSHSQD